MPWTASSLRTNPHRRHTRAIDGGRCGNKRATAAPVQASRSRAAGRSRHSSITAQTAYVSYSPPLKPPAEFDVIDTIALHQPERWALVDQAPRIVGVERRGAGALVKEILDELPPEELDGGVDGGGCLQSGSGICDEANLVVGVIPKIPTAQ